MAYLHSNWRDCQAWKNEGLSLSTTSNEAAKMYDAVITQLVSRYADPGVEGIARAKEAALEADPRFVMGHVLANGMDLLSCDKSFRSDGQLKSNLKRMYALAANSNITKREELHVSAVKEWSEGNTYEACQIWEDILLDHPTDMLALKMAYETYFYLGQQPEIRDSVARVMPKWKTDTPLYWYLHGMYAFGLVETNFYEAAEKYALQGLRMNPRDYWAGHARVHVLEMEGRQDDGINFLQRTQDNWNIEGMTTGHNFWHWAVFHIEKGEHEAALGIYDEKVAVRCKSGAMVDLIDASSLLYRLQMEGIDVGNRWKQLYNIWKPHTEDHCLVLNDAHLLMCALGAKNKDETVKVLASLKEYISDGGGANRAVTREVGLAVCEALVEANEGNFDIAVEILKPVRYKIVKLGGSNAQRDLFNLFLIHAALQSSNPQHHKYARALLIERKWQKTQAPMTDRLISRAMALHAD